MVSVCVFSFLLYRLWLGYRLALRGGYKEYSHPLALTQATVDAASSPLNRPFLPPPTSYSRPSSSPSYPSRSSVLNFPLVFPIYFRLLLLLLALLACQLLLSLFSPNAPLSGPFIFWPAISLYILFHSYEQGLLVFLCQRSIGAGAIRRSLTYAALWGVIVLASILLAVNLDQSRDTGNSTPSGNSTLTAGHVSPAAHPVRPHVLGTAESGVRVRGQRPSGVGEGEDWETGSWMDVSGSVVIIDTSTVDFHWVYLSCALCDAVLLLHYALLFVVRVRCLRIMPWLSSRVAAFDLARFLFLRRLLSLLSILIFVLTSAHPYTFCFNLAVQLYMVAYGLCMYLFLVHDSRFWRKLESLANGPYPAYRSLDDNGTKADTKPSAGVRATSSPGSTPSSSPPSSSIAPLLKLPRQGLANLDPILSHLVDFSELSIDSSHPLAVGQEDTAVYAALYRGEVVAVKRLRCDVLTIELIERELNEARLMSEMSHRHVVRFIGVCIRPPSICLVSELCEGGSLSQWIRDRRREIEDDRATRGERRPRRSDSAPNPLAEEAKEEREEGDQGHVRSVSSVSNAAVVSMDLPASFPLSTVLSFSLDACCALLYLHSSSPPIIHRDVKTSNFVLSPSLSPATSPLSPPYLMKVLDFGESRRFHWVEAGEKRKEEKGTLSWMAPELMKDWRVAQHVKEVMGAEGVKKACINDEELRRLLASVGIHDDGGVEAWKETKEDEDGDWDEIIQATMSMSTAASASHTSASSPTSALSPGSGPPQSSSFSMSPGRFSSNSPSSFLSRSFFQTAARASYAVDIYGLAMLVWCMLSLQPHPFVNIPSFLVPFFVAKGVRPRCPAYTPPLLVRLVRSAWHPEARKRPTAAQMMDRLECIQVQLAGADHARVLSEQEERRRESKSTRRTERGSVSQSGSGSVSREGMGISLYTPPPARRRESAVNRPLLTTFGLPPLMVQPSSSFPSSDSQPGLPSFVTSASAPSEAAMALATSLSPIRSSRAMGRRESAGMATPEGLMESIAQCGEEEEEEEDYEQSSEPTPTDAHSDVTDSI